MIVHNVDQGSSAWHDLRKGIPTVSQFGRFITKAKLQYSAGAKTLVAELVAERLLGFSLTEDVAQTIWTERGTDMEADAWAWYEVYRDVDTEEVGFITNDERTTGGSPDRLVLDSDGERVGGLEIKCRNAANHMKCVAGIEPTAEAMQVQGYLWLTGLPWWDVVAYNPALPNRIDRIYPDAEHFRALDVGIERLLAEVKHMEERAIASGGVVEWDERAGHDDLIAKLYASLEAK